MYNVRFGTGAGDELGIETLEEAKAYADENCSYTQCSITIEDEDGDEVCTRTWVGCESGIEEYNNPIRFGTFGYYADWSDE